MTRDRKALEEHVGRQWGLIWLTREQRGPRRRVIEFFEKFDISGNRVLDLGCGDGKNIPVLLERFQEVTARDISSNAIQRVEDRFGDQGNLKTEVGGFDLSDYPDEHFDFLLAFNVLQHNDWEGAEESWPEVGRVLAPGAHSLITVRSDWHWMPPDGSRKDLEDQRGITYEIVGGRKHGIIIHHYTATEIVELTEAAGLEIISMDRERRPRREGREGVRARWEIHLVKHQ